MKTKSLSPMGALHPILFFAGVYVVVLLFSIFICSALFYSCNSSPSAISNEQGLPQEKPANLDRGVAAAASAVVMR
jgi:hypothetical protein